MGGIVWFIFIKRFISTFSRDKNHVKKLLVRFPHLDLELLEREYPDVKVKDLVYKDRVRGHFAPKID